MAVLANELNAAGMPYPLAEEIEAAVNSRATTADRISKLGVAGPLAIELSRQISAGVANIPYLLAVGLPGQLAVIIAAAISGSTALLRTEPATSSKYYVVARGLLNVGLVTRIEKNVVASADSSNLGGADSGERITGVGLLTDFSLPASGTTWFANEVGAFDFVGRSSGGVNFSSYHGLGVGSVAGTTKTMDGVAFDPFSVARSGSLFELRTQTTASDGTNFVTRDMSVIISEAGKARVKLWSESSTGMTLFYFGMPIASANSYDELQIRRASSGAWTITDLGQDANGATAWLADARQVRMRDYATGYYVGAYGDLPDLAGFTRMRTEKQPSFIRTKTYVGLFSSDAGLSAGSEFTLEWGTSTPGATAAPTQLLADQSWVTGWINNSYTGGSVSKVGTDLTMTWASGTSNLRVAAPITGCVSGNRYLAAIDVITSTANGTREFYISPSLTSNSGVALSGTNVNGVDSAQIGFGLGRNIYMFTANASDPNQTLAVRGALTAAGAVVFRRPAAYAIP